MFCVECGAEGKLYDSLCRECFLKKKRFSSLPNIIDVTLCSQCGAMQKGGTWVKAEDPVQAIIEESTIIERPAEGSMRIEVEEEDPRNFRIRVEVDIRVFDLDAHETHEARVRLKKGVCRSCSRQRGSYYEAIVQLRSKGRPVSETDKEQAKEMAESIVADSGSFITRTEEVKGGLDIYLGSSSDGRALATTLAKRHGSRVSDASKVVGRKDGKDLVRMTFLVRLPSYRRQDLVFMDGSVFEIIGYTKGRVTLVDIQTGRRVSRTPRELESVEVVGDRGSLEKAVVVSADEKEVQVMDPRTYKTVELLNRTDGVPVDEVWVVRHGDDLYMYKLKMDGKSRKNK